MKLREVVSGAELVTLEEQAAGHWVCAFSPDSRRLVSWGREPRLWDAATGAELITLAEQTMKVRGCIFSPNGASVVSAYEDGTLKLWDAETGKELTTLAGHLYPVSYCVFSTDEQRIVSASADMTLRVWDAATGAELATLNGHTNQVISCAFSTDGTRIVSASTDGTLKIWDASARARSSAMGHKVSVKACAYSPDCSHIVSASCDKTLKVWDGTTGALLSTLVGHTDSVETFAFSPDGTKVVSASDDETLILWDLETGAKLATLRGHSTWVQDCGFSPDGLRIVSAAGSGGGGELKVWDGLTGEEIATLTQQAAYACGYSPTGRRILSEVGKTLTGWDAESGEELSTLTDHESVLDTSVYSPDGRLKVWDTVATANVAKLVGYDSRGVSACAYSPDGLTIISACYHEPLKLWDVKTGAELATLAGNRGTVLALAFSPDGQRIVSASAGDTLKLWDVPDKAMLCEYWLGSYEWEHQCVVGWSSEGGRLVVGTHEGAVYLLRLENVNLHPPVITALRQQPPSRSARRGKKSAYSALCPFCQVGSKVSGTVLGNKMTCPNCGEHFKLSPLAIDDERLVRKAPQPEKTRAAEFQPGVRSPHWFDITDKGELDGVDLEATCGRCGYSEKFSPRHGDWIPASCPKCCLASAAH